MNKKLRVLTAPIIFSFLLCFIFVFPAFGLTVELYPADDGSYRESEMCDGCPLPPGFRCCQYIAHGIYDGIFLENWDDEFGDLSFSALAFGILEFDIASLGDSFEPDQLQATLTLTFASIQNPGMINYIYLYDMSDNSENGIIEDNDVYGASSIGTVTFGDQIQPGEKITFDVTQAIAHDIFGPDQSDFSGFVLGTMYEYERTFSFYDRTSLENAPVLTVSITDNPPALGAGPFLAAGTWPVLPTSADNPMYLDANYSVLWKFSDDFASCSEDCTHVAEYQAAGDSSWTHIDVTANAAKGFAYVTLPVESLQNATTYAFRYSVTDCASQTTQSAVYYFRVAITDAPPVITAGPFLAAGYWPVLPTSPSRAIVFDQNYNVLWTFSDDYAFCSGLCTHRARYRKVGDTAWIFITVSADPTGKKYAYTELPVVGLAAGTYQFHFDVLDCAGQRTYAPKVYYFKVE